MKKLILFISFICITSTSKSQINEIGITVGGSNYIGDIGPTYYVNPNNFMGGLIYKWNMNPRIAFRGTFSYAKLTSDDADSNNTGRQLRGLRFTNSVKELAVGMEFNFFEYNISDYRYKSTPYILLKIAAFNYKIVTDEIGPETYNYGSKTSFAIPFGIGYKTLIAGGLTVAFELRATYTFSDAIDYNHYGEGEDRIEALEFGNPNNNDWYVFTGISFTYAFGRPPCYATPY